MHFKIQTCTQSDVGRHTAVKWNFWYDVINYCLSMPGLLNGIHFCEHTFIFDGIFSVIINLITVCVYMVIWMEVIFNSVVVSCWLLEVTSGCIELSVFKKKFFFYLIRKQLDCMNVTHNYNVFCTIGPVAKHACNTLCQKIVWHVLIMFGMFLLHHWIGC